ncbi:MAG: hypothetical protein JWO31_3773, partial [Phycisphaerales bacterium]|nr:hypothetical protein [Phycisphaerales bacterium]
ERAAQGAIILAAVGSEGLTGRKRRRRAAPVGTVAVA